MYKSKFRKIISWVFALYVLTQGILNLMRGNDVLLGVAFLVTSLFYLPPIYSLLHNRTGITIPSILLIIMALSILWITLAIGAVSEGYYPEITS